MIGTRTPFKKLGVTHSTIYEAGFHGQSESNLVNVVRESIVKAYETDSDIKNMIG